MKIAIDWLKDFVDFNLTPQELADTLTALGLEATVETTSYEFDGVVVGRIVSVEPITDTKHLTLCQVDLGDEEIPIVCGAPNVAPEARVAVAKVGARLPGGVKVSKAKLRGHVSQGMICAEDELGLSEDHTGIIILSDKAELGQDIKEYLKLVRETTIDLDLTPNRGDAFSHLGVARDLAAGLNTDIHMPEISIKEGSTPIAKLARIDISSPDGCHRYASRVITGIKIGPSPGWMVKRLEAVGMRSINNVVDASNYVLMELGHPLHVFDYDRLADHRIDVYFAKTGETFTTLDGQERRLGPEHLLIADGNGPVALAGIMGGLDSEVTDDTTNLLIESAYFVPSVIRRGSKSLDLSTEASKRFERDTDVDGLIVALDRVTALIVEVAGGTVAKGCIDVYPVKHDPRIIDLSIAFTNRLLGTTLEEEDIKDCLIRLGISVEALDQDQLRCKVPLNRQVLTQQVDLIEEIARMAGYDQIEAVEGVEVKFQSLIRDSQAHFDQVRHALVPWGFHEHLANTLTREEYTTLFSEDKAIGLKNPLSKEMAFLRTSLMPGLLQAVAFNERRQQRSVQLFEIGAVHRYEAELYNRTRETFTLGLVTTLGSGSTEVHWKKPPPKDLYYLKGILAQLLRMFHVPALQFIETAAGGFTAALKIQSGNSVLGVLGEVNQGILDLFALETPVAIAELSLAQLAESGQKGEQVYRDVVPYPIVERDIAVEVAASTAVGELLQTIEREAGKTFLSARVFDVYSGKGITAGKQSVAFRLYFQSSERTLKDEEVDQQMKKLVKALQHRHQAKWRQA
ncbi:MAG: phenylalanine--tRNA ligase subunit beta [Fidelibacterota bacterium]|nr:MAG: phenylalanine--tRNA ligase subunit beta [Candidatus Neomarinimicrobiota bacterium]